MALLIATMSTTTYAQKRLDNSVSGHVTDAKSGEHLPYISIIIKGTQIGTQTTASGHYTLRNLPSGEFEIVATAVGYQEVSKKVQLKGDESIELNFEISESQQMIDGVVVSATRIHTSRKEAPTLVNVLECQLFARTASPTLAEGLVFQPGVRVENNCQNCGFTQARINGLDGHYSQILIDSRPIFSALAGVYGLEQIPATMIDRVEVVRGGGSALFGSSAIGGTINIITKEAMSSTAEISHSLTSMGISNALDNNTSVNASMVSDNGRAGVIVYGNRRNRDGYDANKDGFTDIPTLNSITFGTRGHLRLNPFSKISLEYHGNKEYRRGGDLLERPPHEAHIAEMAEHLISAGSIGYDGQSPDGKHLWSSYISSQYINRDSYYGGGMDPNAYGHTTNLTLVGGAQYSTKFSRLLFMPAQLTAGVEYNYDDLYDISLGYNYKTEQKVHIASVYLQNEWKNVHWSILAGVRMDKHNLIKNPIFSPRVNIRYSPYRDLGFRLIYAGGFRAPQAFDEDLHISVVGGERIRIKLADNLREERSHSFSLSGDWYKGWDAVQLNLMLEGFFTLLEDTYALRETGLTTDNGMSNIMERYNGSGAKVYGGSIEARLSVGSRFNIQSGFTMQRSLYDEAQQWSDDPNVAPTKELFRSPNLYGYLTTSYSPIKRLSVDISGTYTGSMLTPHMQGSGTSVDVAVRTPSFWDLSLKVGYDFNIRDICYLKLYAGVKNIFNAYQRDFDRGELRDSGYIYGPILPRSIATGVSLRF